VGNGHLLGSLGGGGEDVCQVPAAPALWKTPVVPEPGVLGPVGAREPNRRAPSWCIPSLVDTLDSRKSEAQQNRAFQPPLRSRKYPRGQHQAINVEGSVQQDKLMVLQWERQTAGIHRRTYRSILAC
jgi:hypothetical protein